jgi:hypothetical protein
MQQAFNGIKQEMRSFFGGDLFIILAPHPFRTLNTLTKTLIFV